MTDIRIEMDDCPLNINIVAKENFYGFYGKVSIKVSFWGFIIFDVCMEKSVKPLVENVRKVFQQDQDDASAVFLKLNLYHLVVTRVQKSLRSILEVSWSHRKKTATCERITLCKNRDDERFYYL